MNTVVHFIDVGQGNMVLIEATNGKYYLCDCNITEDNEDSVLEYLADVVGRGTHISAFICTHRDADHMRGVKKIHNDFPIQRIWDSGYPGTTTESDEYREYMELRRKVGYKVKEKKSYNEYDDLGMTRLYYLSAQNECLAKNANAQALVIKVEHRGNGTCHRSAILTGDCNGQTWRDGIMKDYAYSDYEELKTTVLMGAHHGSIDFFKTSADSNNYYTSHIKAMKPAMSVISVGENPHGHPDKKALELYEKYSSGSAEGDKVFTTRDKGTMRLDLPDNGRWSLDSV